MKFTIKKPTYKKKNPKVTVANSTPKNQNLIPNHKEYEPQINFFQAAKLNCQRELTKNPHSAKPRQGLPLEPQLVHKEYSAQCRLHYPSFLLPHNRYQHNL